MYSSQGIAVGAGEIQAETAKQLVETQDKLKETTAALFQARKENEELKKKIGIVGTSAEHHP